MKPQAQFDSNQTENKEVTTSARVKLYPTSKNVDPKLITKIVGKSPQNRQIINSYSTSTLNLKISLNKQQQPAIVTPKSTTTSSISKLDPGFVSETLKIQEKKLSPKSNGTTLQSTAHSTVNQSIASKTNLIGRSIPKDTKHGILTKNNRRDLSPNHKEDVISHKPPQSSTPFSNKPSEQVPKGQHDRRSTSEIGKETTPKPVTRDQAQPQAKITNRPLSASAGQRFIGKNQNLKELFSRNWQNVNITQKVDQSGQPAQIKTLTVLDTNQMVNEDPNKQEHSVLQPGIRIVIPNHEATKCSYKRNGIVRAYAANTNQGLVRNYNEDRVSIIFNIVKPEHRQQETWPKCSFFGVYDGHGGSACAEFLRDNLHQFVIREDSFPWDPNTAIREGFKKAEAKFIQSCQQKDEKTGQTIIIERSGSCAICVLILGEICYVANVGDSRAVLSSNGGQQMTALSRDHKPSDVDEYKRIVQAGGQIYQTTTAQQPQQRQQQNSEDLEYIIGPIRVLPGRLSVCRTFGDPEAKLEFRGGNPNVVKAEPDITSFQIAKNHDFIVLGSDGIFDKLSDEDTGKCVWLSCEAAKTQMQQGKEIVIPGAPKDQYSISVHQHCGLGVEGILKNSLYRQSLDNVTVVVVAFQNFKRMLCGSGHSQSKDKDDLIDQKVIDTSKSSKNLNSVKTSIQGPFNQRSISASGLQLNKVQKVLKQELTAQEQENNLNLANNKRKEINTSIQFSTKPINPEHTKGNLSHAKPPSMRTQKMNQISTTQDKSQLQNSSNPRSYSHQEIKGNTQEIAKPLQEPTLQSSQAIANSKSVTSGIQMNKAQVKIGLNVVQSTQSKQMRTTQPSAQLTLKKVNRPVSTSSATAMTQAGSSHQSLSNLFRPVTTTIKQTTDNLVQNKQRI